MAFKELSKSVDKLGDKFQEYSESIVEFYKLRLFKSTMKGAVSLVHLLVFGSIFLLVLLFLSVGAAFLIGNSLDSVSSGFFIIGGFYVIVLFLVYYFGKKTIEKNMLLKFSKVLYEDDDITPAKAAEQELETFKKEVVLEKPLDS